MSQHFLGMFSRRTINAVIALRPFGMASYLRVLPMRQTICVSRSFLGSWRRVQRGMPQHLLRCANWLSQFAGVVATVRRKALHPAIGRPRASSVSWRTRWTRLPGRTASLACSERPTNPREFCSLRCRCFSRTAASPELIGIVRSEELAHGWLVEEFGFHLTALIRKSNKAIISHTSWSA